MNLRSLAVGVFVAALLGFGSAARGQEFIKTGEPVILELPLENEDTSTTTAQGARIVATFEEVSPAGLASYLSIDVAGSTLGPVAIPVGAANAKTFRVKVVLTDGAPDGSFKVRLHPTVENAGLFMSPDPETLDTLTPPFQIDRTVPVASFVDAAGEPLLDEADRPVQNGGIIKSKEVIVRATDAGSGIALVTIDGPAPFLPTTYEGNSVADTTFWDLENGDYTVTIEDRAGNKTLTSFSFTTKAVALSVEKAV